jgi:hypothetical protein
MMRAASSPTRRCSRGCSYDSTDKEDRAAVDALGEAAAANENVRNEDGVSPAPAGSSGETTRKSSTGVQPGSGVQKKGSTKKGKGKKKVVSAVSASAGKQVAQADVQQYARVRGGGGGSGATAERTEADKEAEKEAAAEEKELKDTEDASPDDSLEAEEEDMDELDEPLEEDRQVGGLDTAIDVWLAAIKYTAALHTSIADPFDKAAIKAHAAKCGETGRAWASRSTTTPSNDRRGSTSAEDIHTTNTIAPRPRRTLRSTRRGAVCCRSGAADIEFCPRTRGRTALARAAPHVVNDLGAVRTGRWASRRCQRDATRGRALQR